MEPDSLHESRYFTVDNDGGVHNGWINGWKIFRRDGSPVIHLDTKSPKAYGTLGLVDVGDLKLAELWPDTEHYDQNSPGIMASAADRANRLYESWIDKAFWLNVLRVPICVQYLAACAKVRPRTILELGTGGSSAHSTGMFLQWLEGEQDPLLISVDRHPLSDAWPRYRQFEHWRFVQGDSINVMHALLEGKIEAPKRFDLIFIDSSHDYEPTLAELNQASFMTDAILMDDTTHHGVDEALKEWQPQNPDWLRVNLGATVALLERRPQV